MRVLVCGGRNYQDRDAVFREFDAIPNVTIVIHGGATGADSLAGGWAKARGVHQAVYPANWTFHGDPAGPIRNAFMLVDSRPDLVLAFPGQRGTADMVRRARAAGVTVREIP